MITVEIAKMKSKVVFYLILCQVFGLSPEDEVKLNIEELRYKFNMLECLMNIIWFSNSKHHFWPLLIDWYTNYQWDILIMMCHSTPENTFPFYTFDSYLYGDGTFTDDIMNKVSISHNWLMVSWFWVYKEYFKTF